ncbi:MAG TPA: Ig-like domain repeat protein, partial [Terracidiphilus sp.]
LFFVDSHSGTAMATVQPLPAKLIFLYNPFPFQTNPPSAMAADTSDNLYSMWSNGSVCELVQASLYNAENSNVSFVKIAGGHTCGFSGDGGIAGNAEIGAGVGQITFDTAGDLYFSDTSNQRVRRIDYTTGIIRTIAGNGTAGYTGDSAGGPGAELSAPTGVGVNSQGAVYIISSAATGQVIRKLGPNGIVNFGNQGKGTTSAAHQSTVTNTGNSAMVLSTYSFSGPNASEFKINPPTTTCGLTNGSQLFSGQTCQIGVIFTPTAAGTRTANLVLAGNTITGFNTIQLIGNGVKPSPTFTITSPAGGSSVKSGTAVTFSVKVTSTLTPAPTGTVQFKVDGANFGGPVTLAGGVASTSVTGLTQTSHTLSAVYNGDANYAPAGPISVSITVTAVKVGSFVSLSPTVNAAGSCAAPGFTVSVTGKSGPAPLGEVQLLDGSKVLGTASLANGKATLSTHGLSAGPHTLTARYAGDDLHLGSVSSTLTENVRPTKPCTGPVSGNGARTVAF